MKDRKYISYGHAKTRLRYHIIFCTKYRRKCLEPIRDKLLEIFRDAEKASHFRIYNMELDKEHIHFTISFPPAYSIEQTVRRMKQYSTYRIYNDATASARLKQFYWKTKRVLWAHGYFCSTIGDVSKEKLKEYIENQR